jgi:hypothetical protein
MGEALPLRSARISRSREGFKHRVVEEVREWSVPNVVQQTGDTQRLHNEPFAWRRFAVVGESRRE